MRKLLFALALLTSLGCSGLSRAIFGSGGDGVANDDTAGAPEGDAKIPIHPKGFPLPPLEPGEGSLHQSLSLSVAGTQTTTLIYELTPSVSDALLLGRYRRLLEAAGHEVSYSEDLGTPSISSNIAVDRRVGVSIARSGDHRTLTLVLSIQGT
ncbi:MAG TPA: hypothetical protein ENK18_20960 [Deltaproteobacteria bacterium]|nr:hypothetical protein [Deltaproteobacteria bacterium]